jgi:hypothetical protein
MPWHESTGCSWGYQANGGIGNSAFQNGAPLPRRQPGAVRRTERRGPEPHSGKPTYQDLAGHGWGTRLLHLANHADSYRGVCYVEHDLRRSGFET